MSERLPPAPPAVTHEANTIGARGVVLAMIALALLLVSSLLVVHFFQRTMSSELSPPEGYWKPEATLPPNPDQPAQLNELRESEQRLLSEYAWIDDTKQVARIPIERAKQLLLERDSTKQEETK